MKVYVDSNDLGAEIKILKIKKNGELWVKMNSDEGLVFCSLEDIKKQIEKQILEELKEYIDQNKGKFIITRENGTKEKGYLIGVDVPAKNKRTLNELMNIGENKNETNH